MDSILYLDALKQMSVCLGKGAGYCDQFVCLCVSVFPRAYLWNRWTDRHEIFVQIPCGRGSALLWRRCDILCTSSFMDDVTFGRNETPGRSLMSTNVLLWIVVNVHIEANGV